MKKVLFLHGWTNRRPTGHWMRITASALRQQGHQVWYPQFPNPDKPNPAQWQDLLRQESNMMDEVSGGEKIVIAHSLGTINWLYGALTDLFDKPFDRALMVAVPDPVMTNQAEGIEGEPMNFARPEIHPQASKWAKDLQLISSDQDRWQPNGVEKFEEAFRTKSLIYPGAGHFSLDDGWGKWSGLEKWVESSNPQDLMQR
jgi:predicted alpha/beta hydrolase family esterase